MSSIDEQILIEQAQQEPQAFATLYNRYVDRIYAYAYRLVGDDALAKDMTALTFEKALRNLHHFEWRGLTFGAWLYRIAYNEVVSYQRRQRFLTPLATIEKWWRSDTNVEAEVQAHQQQEFLHVALQRLPQEDQDVLVLRFYEALSSREVGQILGYTENKVNVRIHRALKRLKAEIHLLESIQGASYVSE